MSTTKFRVLQLQSHHAGSGRGDVDVMNHERDLLVEAGHVVDRVEVPSAEESGLSTARQVGKVLWNREAAAEVDRRIAQWRPDVLHVHSPYPLMSPSVIRTGSKAGVPTVVTLHNYVFNCVAGTLQRDGGICHDCLGKKLKVAGVRHGCYHGSKLGSAVLTTSVLLHRSVGSLGRDVDRYLALTAFARDLMVRDGYSAGQVEVKANSVPDAGKFRAEPDLDSPYVLFAGRLMDIKGVHTLLDAWSRLPVSGLRLVIAGDGEMRGLVEEATKRGDGVEYVGWVSQQEVAELMAGATATVIPSEWYEGLPLVLVRSLSVGTPVIVSSLETMEPTVTADGVGRVFAMGDAAGLAEQLSSVVTHSEQWRAMRGAARSSFEARYSPEQSLRDLENVYAAVVRERRASGNRRGANPDRSAE